MLLVALIVSSSVVSFSVIALIGHVTFGIAWSVVVPAALIVTALGHLLGLLWLHALGKG
jgi:hypothetical protein